MGTFWCNCDGNSSAKHENSAGSAAVTLSEEIGGNLQRSRKWQGRHLPLSALREGRMDHKCDEARPNNASLDFILGIFTTIDDIVAPFFGTRSKNGHVCAATLALQQSYIGWQFAAAALRANWVTFYAVQSAKARHRIRMRRKRGERVKCRHFRWMCVSLIFRKAVFVGREQLWTSWLLWSKYQRDHYYRSID